MRRAHKRLLRRRSDRALVDRQLRHAGHGPAGLSVELIEDEEPSGGRSEKPTRSNAADNCRVHAVVVVGVVLVVIGAIWFVFGHRIARLNASLHFSHEEIRGTSGRWRRWVRPFIVTGTIMNMAVGLFFVLEGVEALLGVR